MNEQTNFELIACGTITKYHNQDSLNNGMYAHILERQGVLSQGVDTWVGVGVGAFLPLVLGSDPGDLGLVTAPLTSLPLFLTLSS